VSRYLVSPEGNSDIFEIWRWIAKDSVPLADRVEGELYEIFELKRWLECPARGMKGRISRAGRFCSSRSIPT
jgi:plasmid stabilization system protein ParE